VVPEGVEVADVLPGTVLGVAQQFGVVFLAALQQPKKFSLKLV